MFFFRTLVGAGFDLISKESCNYRGKTVFLNECAIDCAVGRGNSEEVHNSISLGFDSKLAIFSRTIREKYGHLSLPPFEHVIQHYEPTART